MTSRGPGDSWTPGSFPRPNAPVPPPLVSGNPAQIVPTDAVATTGSANHVDYSTPRHAAPDDRLTELASVDAPPATTARPRRSAWNQFTRTLTRRSRMAELDSKLIAHLRDTPTTYGKVAFVCAKGGVSKTVHTIAVSAILSEYTDSAVAAVDFNPDQGTLGTRAAPQQEKGRTIRDLIDTITYGDTTIELDDFLTETAHGLSVVASGNTSIDAKDITAMQYESVMNVLHERFPLILIDTGNSMTTEVFESILQSVDQIVLVSNYVVDGAVTAANTLNRIRQAGGRLEAIANQSLVSIMKPDKLSPRVDTDRIRDHFSASTVSGSIRDIPWDSHLSEGGVISLDALAPETRREFTILAADIASTLSGRPLFSTTILPDYF